MTLLVPVSRDPVRERVLDTAIDLGRALGEGLYVVHVIDNEVADSEEKAIRDELIERIESGDVEATVALEYASHSFARSGPRIGQELIDLAADVEISHIVMGHTSKGPIEGLAHGSVAFSVADAAMVPVTIVSEPDS